MTAREISFLEIELVVRADNADAKVAQGQLAALLDLVGIVEVDRFSAVDKGDAARAYHLADVAADDERGVLVDAETQQLGVLGNDHEETLQPAPLLKVGVDDRLEAEQAETGADVLFDEIAFLIDLAAGHGQFGERGRAGTRSTDHAATPIQRLDLRQRARSAERGDELHLIAAAEKDRGRIANRRRDLAIAIVARLSENRDLHVRRAGTAKIAEPGPRRAIRIRRRGREADDRRASVRVDETEELLKGLVARPDSAAREDERSRRGVRHADVRDGLVDARHLRPIAIGAGR